MTEEKNLQDITCGKSDTFAKLYAYVRNVCEGKQGLIFDMDGTLIDSMPMWRNLDLEYLGQYGITPGKEFHHTVATMTLMDASAYIQTQFQIPKTAQEIYDDFQTMVLEQYRNQIPLKSYVYELVTQLKKDGYRIAVATANEIHLSELVLERTGLMDVVDTIVSCTMAGASKETPDVYYLAAKNMQTAPELCVVFEDSLRAMITAKKAGFTTVAVYDSVAADSWTEICSLTDGQVVLA